MKFLNIHAENFSSYKTLTFDFSETELSLIHGNTGSGKSTLMDIPCWILFGITAKDGNVDEVRSWNTPESPTEATLRLLANDDVEVLITRVRGTSKQNDLYMVENGDVIRGKDITETQKLINERLGISAELFLRAAYFSEFTPSGAFFTAKSKDRKQLFEIITDLSFPIKIQLKAEEIKKISQKDIASSQILVQKLSSKFDQLNEFIEQSHRKSNLWAKERNVMIASLKLQHDKFEETKKSKIDALQLKHDRWNLEHKKQVLNLKEKFVKKFSEVPDSNPCPTCGNVDHSAQITLMKAEQAKLEISRLEAESNPFFYELQTAMILLDPFKDRINDLEGSVDPFHGQLVDLNKQKDKTQCDIYLAKNTLSKLTVNFDNLEKLQQIAHDLKTHLLHNSIRLIQQSTNKHLQTYFDSEFSVIFDVKDSNDLDVQIFKNGHECVYTQLSKGQRSLLKLVFSVSVMEAASNTSGIHFDNLFFDEPTDGTDSDLKNKSYRLFEDLNKSHKSVLIIDHSDTLKALFNNQYKVDLIGDCSQINKYE